MKIVPSAIITGLKGIFVLRINLNINPSWDIKDLRVNISAGQPHFTDNFTWSAADLHIFGSVGGKGGYNQGLRTPARVLKWKTRCWGLWQMKDLNMWSWFWLVSSGRRNDRNSGLYLCRTAANRQRTAPLSQNFPLPQTQKLIKRCTHLVPVKQTKKQKETKEWWHHSGKTHPKKERGHNLLWGSKNKKNDKVQSPQIKCVKNIKKTFSNYYGMARFGPS